MKSSLILMAMLAFLLLIGCANQVVELEAYTSYTVPPVPCNGTLEFHDRDNDEVIDKLVFLLDLDCLKAIGEEGQNKGTIKNY